MLSSWGGNGRAKVKLQAAGIGADCHPHARGMKMPTTPNFGDGGCGRMRFPWQQNGSIGRPEDLAIPSARCTMIHRMWTSGYLNIWISEHLDIWTSGHLDMLGWAGCSGPGLARGRVDHATHCHGLMDRAGSYRLAGARQSDAGVAIDL